MGKTNEYNKCKMTFIYKTTIYVWKSLSLSLPPLKWVYKKCPHIETIAKDIYEDQMHF